MKVSAAARSGIAAIAIAASCFATAPVGASANTSGSGTDEVHSWTYLAMGDSNVYGPEEYCGGCTGYPLLLADKIPAATGTPVHLLNASQWNKLTAAKLLDEILANDWGGSSGADPWSRLPGAQPAPRPAIAQADIITIQVGFNDLPWLAWEDVCEQVYDRACRERVIPEYLRNLDAILTQVDELRAGQPTAVRVATVFNDVITGGYDNSTFYDPAVLAQGLTSIRAFVREMSRKTCAIAAQHHAECLDLARLFNGPQGTRPVAVGVFTPEFGDMNQPGQDLIADELMRMGWAPLLCETGTARNDGRPGCEDQEG